MINQTIIGGIVTNQPQERGAAVGFMVKTWRLWDGKVFSTKHLVEVFGKKKQDAMSLRPGQSVVITGRMERTSYEKDGAKVWTTKLTAMDISTNATFNDPEPRGQQGGQNQGQYQGNHQGGQQAGPYGQPQQQQGQQQQQQQGNQGQYQGGNQNQGGGQWGNQGNQNQGGGGQWGNQGGNQGGGGQWGGGGGGY